MNEENDAASSIYRVALEFDQLARKASPSVPYLSQKHLLGLMQALAAHSHMCQDRVHTQLEDIVRNLARSGLVRPAVFTHHLLYDETPLRMRISFPQSPSGQMQLGKIWVVEHEYTILLEEVFHNPERENAERFLLIRSMRSPEIRCSATGTAESALQVLQSTWVPSDSFAKLFTCAVRLCETDESGTNLKCERLLQSRGDRSSTWQVFHQVCMAHKLHSAGQKCLLMEALHVKGLARTLLCFANASMTQAFQARLFALIEKKAVLFKHAPALTKGAMDFRATVLQCFLPSEISRRRRKVELFAKNLCNGDWRSSQHIVHYCTGCCRDRPHLIGKLKEGLNGVVKGLRPRLLNRSNWSSWSESFNFVGMMCAVHALLPQAGGMGSFRPEAADDQGAVAEEKQDESDEKLAAIRRETAENMKVMTEWLATDTALDGLLRLKRCLSPQITFMHELLSWHNPQSELNNLVAQMDDQTRRYLAVEFVTGRVSTKFFSETWALLGEEQSEGWQSLPGTEAEASRIFRLLARPAALVHIHIVVTWRRWPNLLFGLLDDSMREDVIAKLLGASPCQMDAFTAHFYALYPDRTALCSTQCQQLLHSLALQLRCTTWSTEALHARHARRTRSRRGTHPFGLQTLGTIHGAHTKPSWQLQLEKCTDSAESPDDLQACLLASVNCVAVNAKRYQTIHDIVTEVLESGVLFSSEFSWAECHSPLLPC